MMSNSENQNQMVSPPVRRGFFRAFVEDWSVTIIVIGLLAILLFWVIGVVPVSGRSMLPLVESYQEQNNYVITLRNAEYDRGDVIIIEHGDKLLIKRVIALEGDVVSFGARLEEGRIVYHTLVNGVAIDEDYILEPMVVWHDSYLTPIVVGEGEVYVMGDNRNQSGDSRDYGVMKTEDYQGKVVLVLNRSGWIWL